MQPYPSQSHLSKATHLLIKTIYIGPSRMESPTGFSQDPFKRRIPTFHYKISSFCCVPIFSLLEALKVPPKNKQDFNKF